MTIPDQSVQIVILPRSQSPTIKIKRKQDNIKPENIEGLQTGRFKLDEGEFHHDSTRWIYYHTKLT